MKLRTARRKKRMTQGELARRIGRTQAFVAFLERGRTKKPTYDDVMAIAGVLECDPRDLSFTGSRERRQ